MAENGIEEQGDFLAAHDDVVKRVLERQCGGGGSL